MYYYTMRWAACWSLPVAKAQVVPQNLRHSTEVLEVSLSPLSCVTTPAPGTMLPSSVFVPGYYLHIIACRSGWERLPSGYNVM